MLFPGEQGKHLGYSMGTDGSVSSSTPGSRRAPSTLQKTGASVPKSYKSSVRRQEPSSYPTSVPPSRELTAPAALTGQTLQGRGQGRKQETSFFAGRNLCDSRKRVFSSPIASLMQNQSISVNQVHENQGLMQDRKVLAHGLSPGTRLGEERRAR